MPIMCGPGTRDVQNNPEAVAVLHRLLGLWGPLNEVYYLVMRLPVRYILRWLGKDDSEVAPAPRA